MTEQHVQIRKSLQRRRLRRCAVVAALAVLIARFAALLCITTAVGTLQKTGIRATLDAWVLAVAASILVAALV